MASSASPAATYAALIVSSLVVGYWIGVGRSLNFSRGGAKEEDWSDASDNESIASGDVDLTDKTDLAEVKAKVEEELKLVLVVRTDLNMTKGKIAAQCGHATLACYKALQKDNPSLLRHWERSGQAKVALKCSSEEEMLALQSQARRLNLCARSIQDAGRTQIAAGSRTVLGVGPGPVSLINQVTGKLKLL